MKHPILRAMLVIVIVFSVVSTARSTEALKQAEITISIGHIGTFTGDEGIYGQWENEGIQFALDELAKTMHLVSINVINEDDQGEPKRAVSAIQKLISVDNVPAVIGATLSSTTLACAPIANDSKVVLLSASAQSPKISEAGSFVFRIFVSSRVEGRQLSLLAKKLGIKTASVMYAKTDYGIGLNRVLSKALPEHGIQIGNINNYLPKQTDFSTLAVKATKNNPDALFLLGFPHDMARVIKQLRQIGFKGKILAPASFEVEEVASVAGSAADGVFYVYPTLPNNPASQELARKFKEKFQKEMNVYHAVAHDATLLFQHAMESVVKSNKPINGETIRNTLVATNLLNGASGPISFDSNRDAVDRPMEMRISKGKTYELFRDRPN